MSTSAKASKREQSHHRIVEAASRAVRRHDAYATRHARRRDHPARRHLASAHALGAVIASPS